MANTYVQLYTYFVFAVKYRHNFIHESFREEIQKYMTGLLRNQGQKVYSIYCMPDHVHILVSKSGTVSESEMMRVVKSNSSRLINEKGWLHSRFEWQTGFGAFSYSRSALANVIAYIENQPAHHRIYSFKHEYLEILQRFQIEYDPQYLFEFY